MKQRSDCLACDRRALLGACGVGLVSLTLPSACSSQGVVGFKHDSGAPPDAGDDTGDDATGDDASGDDGGCSPTCTTDSNTLVLTFAAHPKLAQPGNSITVTDHRYKDPLCGLDIVIVAHTSAGQYVAFSASCTHACCQVTFTGSGFHCPCHQSTFDLKGQVTGGPAPDPLPQLQVCSDDCGVYVKLR